MNVFEMAKKYYPKLWDIERLTTLVNAGKLTVDEFNAIIENKGVE